MNGCWDQLLLVISSLKRDRKLKQALLSEIALPEIYEPALQASEMPIKLNVETCST